ncbi:trigger factor [Alphaproteobacteria bacterium]|nr:trigger factor [Alphaproteobacteria bacterium]
MNVSETKSEGLLREYQIVITAAEIDAEVSKKLEEIATTVKMPGFRPGKVPMSVVKSRFSDQVRGDAIKAALDEGARQAIEGNDLRLASQPQVDIKSYEDGKDLEASLAVEVMPAITLPDLGKVSVDRPKVDSDPKEVEETLGRIADENRPTAPISKARAAKLGDVAMIDFIGRIDGKPFEGGTADGHSLELGSNSFIPGFEEGLVGAKLGATIDVPVTFPEDYQAAHLAGKLAVFEVKVNELHKKADASIDDELAIRLGFENLDGLKGAIAEQINGQHQTALRQLTKKNVLDALAKGDAFDVPPSLFKQEYESVARAMNPNTAEQEHDQDHDHDHDHPAADEGMDDDAKAEAEAVATRRVRLGLLVTEIGRENNIEVTEEDTRRAVFEEARRYPGQEQMVLEYFQKNPQAMQQIAGPIFEDKVIDFILEMAKVTDVTIDTDTLYNAPEEGATAKKASTKKAAAKKPVAKKAAAKKSTAKK